MEIQFKFPTFPAEVDFADGASQKFLDELRPHFYEILKKYEDGGPAIIALVTLIGEIIVHLTVNFGSDPNTMIQGAQKGIGAVCAELVIDNIKEIRKRFPDGPSSTKQTD